MALSWLAVEIAEPNMSWLKVTDYQHPEGWADRNNHDELARQCCRQLEQAQILFFDYTPFELPLEHREFLRSRQRSDSRVHKNVSYRPKGDALRGYSGDREETAKVRQIMRRYSAEVTRFLSEFLSPYAPHWMIDFASYRPLEEEGRHLPLHKRNDLLHVDAFPSRPTKGGRILRVFTNLHPVKARVWITTDRFDVLAQRFGFAAGLKQIAEGAASSGFLRRGVRSLLNAVGLPDRSAYDLFMLRFHDYLKENSEFQNSCRKIRLEFPPNSTWIVFTDAVPHAVLSGQFALEHTYIVPVDELVSPEHAPIRVLESLCGTSLS